jgi:uncharacterized protein involved in tellurium resistance
MSETPEEQEVETIEIVETVKTTIEVQRERRYFEGDCTCDHFKDEHGWGSCDQPGCDCAAGWSDERPDGFESDLA